MTASFSGKNTQARRSALQDAERLRLLSETERDMIRLANSTGFRRWMEQIQNTGGCAHPIYLAGRTIVLDAQTGSFLRHYDTAQEPGGVLPVRCRNRRQTRCPSCSRLHSGDTFQLVRAGLVGGKGTPAYVADHPRLFVTLTAPSFGSVHRHGSGGERCKPRRDRGFCQHGNSLGCATIHTEDDPAIGQPLCPQCYDYTAHILWHANTGELWDRTIRKIRRRLASAAGITQTELTRHARLSFAKVAEYQKRGAVHFHAVIRLDGPAGPSTHPPLWATTALLESVIREAASTAQSHMPYVNVLGEHVFRWGGQLDIHPILACESENPVTPEAVAAYVGKYVSKSIGDAGGTDRPITHPQQIDRRRTFSSHIRTLMRACWRLGGLSELRRLKLRTWTHTLGYRGHCLSKSHRYSTTYRSLRADRAAHTGLIAQTDTEIVAESNWRYVRSGHSLAESEVAVGVAHDRIMRREMLKLERDSWKIDTATISRESA